MSTENREFTRAEYSRQVGWPERIRREGPFLESVLAGSPPDGVLLDLGCGTGEHSRFLAERGETVVGLDFSQDAMLEAAAATRKGGTIWVRADLRRLPLRENVGRAALCLGNTLVILEEDSAILAALRRVHRALVPGGALLIQILNYHRLRAKGVRSLPLNFRRVEDAEHHESEHVYIRLMDFDEPRHVSFHVVTIERRAGMDDVAVRDSVRRRLRTLEHDELVEMLKNVGFSQVQTFGDYARATFDPLESPDVIAVARRE